MLTSFPSQPSRLGDTLVLGNNTRVKSIFHGLPSEIARQGEDVSAHELTIKQKRAKQICNADQKRFRQFYNGELQRKRPGQFCSGGRPRGGSNKTFQAREGRIGTNKAAQEKLRARQEQRVKDDQLRESRRLARQRAWQEQRVKDDQLLERYRLRELPDGELRESRLQQDGDAHHSIWWTTGKRANLANVIYSYTICECQRNSSRTGKNRKR